MYKLKLNVLRWRYKLHLMNWKERAMYEAYISEKQYINNFGGF